MKGNIISSDVDRHHPSVTRLIVATESGDVAKVKRLLKSKTLSGARAKAASVALGAIDPLENPVLSAFRLWETKSHKTKEKRPNKRVNRRAIMTHL
jgi:hypothetical protein